MAGHPTYHVNVIKLKSEKSKHTFLSDMNNSKYLFYKFMVSFKVPLTISSLVQEPVHNVVLKEYCTLSFSELASGRIPPNLAI